MRKLLIFAFFLPLMACEQSSLPPCPKSGIKHNCVGSTTSPDGEKYVGGFRDDKRNGQGTLTYPDGENYVGEFRDDKPNGRGVRTFPNGERYEGEEKDGKRNGQGTYTHPDGLKYVGEFLDETRHGQGTLTYPNGHKYVGEFRDGKFHGQGALTYPDGHKYVGEFWADKFHGQGTYTHPDGHKYVGEFRNGNRNGEGIMYWLDGTIAESGRWENDRLAQQFALDTARFPFNSQVADTSKADHERVATEAERKRQQELEQKLAAETREKQRLASEAEAERKKRRELEEQMARQKRPTTPPPVNASIPRNPHALVIGNAAYPGSGRLDNPVNDATAISQKLRAMGFTVTVVNDADRQRLVQAMSQFRKAASNADLSLLFYSGHGVQIFGTNYILPIDVDQSDVRQATVQGVSLNSVVENFLPGKTKIIILDACRDNPLQRTGDRSVSKGLAPIAVAQGTLIAYATKEGQTASDGTGQKNSPFTTALLQHISDPEDIAVVLRKVREKVMAATGGKQQPWEYGSLTGGALVLSDLRR